jgi:hypothetical protein
MCKVTLSQEGRSHVADMPDVRLCVGVKSEDAEPVRIVPQDSICPQLLCGCNVVGA